MLTDGIQVVDGSQAVNFQIQSGTTLPTTGTNIGELFYLTSGQVGLYSHNGTAWARVGEGLGATDTTYELVSTIQGKPTASANVLNFVATRAFTLPVGLTTSRARAGSTATGAVAFTIKKNNTSIGSANFAGGSAVGTFTFATAVSFAIGDLLQITAPATQDATLADISIALTGTKA